MRSQKREIQISRVKKILYLVKKMCCVSAIELPMNMNKPK
jgi:hypothetical protein